MFSKDPFLCGEKYNFCYVRVQTFLGRLKMRIDKKKSGLILKETS